MLVLPACRVVFGLWVFLVFAAYKCWGENDTVQVVGGVECADCGQYIIKTSQAFKGLKVTIHCKSGNGKLKTRGAGEVDQEGTFRATLPDYKIAKNGGKEELKEDCFARLHGASGAPCAVQNDPKDSKVVLKSKKANGEHVLGLHGSLKISRTTCPSAFLWLFPFPKFPIYPFPPPSPVYATTPPPQPEASPPPQVPQPLPPPPSHNPPPSPVPAYHHRPRPRPPTSEPLPPPPLYHHPSPPPVPVYSQPPPTPSPAYKNPTPQPSAPSPDYGPRIPKAPPIPQLPRTPTTPRKFFNKPNPPSPYRA